MSVCWWCVRECACTRAWVHLHAQVQGPVTVFNTVIQVSFIGKGTSEQRPDGSERVSHSDISVRTVPDRETI